MLELRANGEPSRFLRVTAGKLVLVAMAGSETVSGVDASDGPLGD